MELIYKIVPAPLWRKAGKLGTFAGAPADISDGFIHFSFLAQLKETAAKWFCGQDDLILIAVDCSKLGDKLRFEPSRNGALFPHLYSSLPLNAVTWARPLVLLPDGRHDFDALLKTTGIMVRG